MPNKPSSKVWKYYGDNLDGQFAHCLLCKYDPNKGVDLHIKVNAGSTPALRNHMRWHHKKEFLDMEAEESDERKEKAPLEDLVIVKCNLELQTHSDTELLHFVCSYGMTLIFKYNLTI